MSSNKRKLCSVCNQDYLTKNFINHLRSAEHKKKLIKIGEDYSVFKLIDVAFDCRLSTFILENFSESVILPEEFQKKNKQQIIDLIENLLEQHETIKICLELFCDAEIPTKDTNEIINLISGNREVYTSTNLNEMFDEIVEKILKQSEEFEIKQSGWSLNSVNHLQINVNKMCSLRGKGGDFELTKFLANKKAIVNVKNKDDKCFLWSLMAFKENKKNPFIKNLQRVNRYKSFSHYFEDYLSFQYPMKLKDIGKFEITNKISINVFSYNEELNSLGTLHVTKNELDGNHANLLLLENNNTFHYCWIKNLSRLVSQQITKRHGAKYLCIACLLYFPSEEKLKAHKEKGCFNVVTKMPTEQNNEIKFTEIHKMLTLLLLFIVIANVL